MTNQHKGLEPGPDGRLRCWWHGGHEDYIRYHDEEWGRPVAEDHRLFEKIILEGFQSGLSWLTILRKRDNFREAFHDFDYGKIADFKGEDVDRLMKNEGIVRHRRKIESAINNAKRARELADEFGSLAAFFWSFEPNPADRPQIFDYEALTSRTDTEESRALSSALKERGWSFIGPTTA
ncbi:MAG: DNA-3-methyladenine glycosylase I, partial [Saprospiraceae bacterium]|nr:DNA-3-methyladenine glycosylase I [Saprospiraceae bacterium]